VTCPSTNGVIQVGLDVKNTGTLKGHRRF
jgi:hypothetical protein